MDDNNQQLIYVSQGRHVGQQLANILQGTQIFPVP